ncbi:MAG: hypothetical protein R3320_08920 [Nitriliruptorales bacterium]|nr:hypothetical protein [Nitriliruptorales bacterium]
MAQKHILVRGTKSGLPYSKGLLARSVQAIGLSPANSWTIAERLERQLIDSGREQVTVDELREAVVELLRTEVGEDASQRYADWQRAQDRDRPLILLIGGATGVGKSTVATAVAGNLGITRIVSTDAVRDVMRATVSQELLPTLHVSSFETNEAPVRMKTAERSETATLLNGYLRQTEAVTVGVEQIIRRAVKEQMDTVVEGVHVVPGFLRLPSREDAIIVQCVLEVEDYDLHRGNFDARGQHQRRPGHRYLEHFTQIRMIQAEVVELARSQGVPIVRSYALDTTVEELTALVVSTVIEYLDVDRGDDPSPRLRDVSGSSG